MTHRHLALFVSSWDMDDGLKVHQDTNGLETFDGDEDQELSEVGRVRSDFINDSRFAPY